MKKTPELFDQSNEEMKLVEFHGWPLPQVSVGEFWWYFEGINIGQEISKDGNMKRPCLIVKSVPHSSLVHILPLTTKIQSDKDFQFVLHKRTNHWLKKASALLVYQYKCIDKKRLMEKIPWKRIKWWLLKMILSKI